MEWLDELKREERLKEQADKEPAGMSIGQHVHAKFPPHGEGMWVRVTRTEPDGTVDGILDNRPVDSPAYRLGQSVRLKHDEKEGWIPVADAK